MPSWWSQKATQGKYSKMYNRISGRENHYIGFRNSLQTFATDLSQLSLRYVMYIWNLETM